MATIDLINYYLFFHKKTTVKTSFLLVCSPYIDIDNRLFVIDDTSLVTTNIPLLVISVDSQKRISYIFYVFRHGSIHAHSCKMWK